MLNEEEISPHSVWVIIMGEAFEMPHSLNETQAFMEDCLNGEILFEHEHPKTGAVTLLKIPAGMPVRIVNGEHMKASIKEQRVQQMLQVNRKVHPFPGEGPQRMI